MNKRLIYGICALLAIFLIASRANAAIWEIHPGVYASYLYTDNYRATSENEMDEDIYAVGPSLALACSTQVFRWELVGHIAKDFHNRFKEDDSTEGGVTTHALASGQYQSLDLSYDYRETRERETLDQAFGVRRIHTGALTYNRTVSPTVGFSVGYTRTMEYAPSPDEDVISNGGTYGLHYQMTPRNMLDLSLLYEGYQYEIRPDVDVYLTSLRWRYALSQQVGLGPDLGFERHKPLDLPYQDVYTAAFFLEYTLSSVTSLSASTGESWLRSEDQDAQRYSVTHARLGIRRDTQNDHIIASLFHGYRYEYSTYATYGIYKATDYDVSWEHLLTPTVMSNLGYVVSKRTPIETATVEEAGRDIIYRVGLTYRTANAPGGPGFRSDSLRAGISGFRTKKASQQSQGETSSAVGATTPTEDNEPGSGDQSMINWPRGMIELHATYEHLTHVYEISDTVKENRYGLSAEVRY